jgi:hypothetical protein
MMFLSFPRARFGARMHLPLLVVLLGCAVLAAGPQSPKQGNTKSANGRSGPVGLNLSAINDWSREWAFVDLYKGSRPWTLGGPGELKFDSSGNPQLGPGQTAWTLLAREVDGHYPAGKYTATWKGKGDVQITRWDVARVLSKTANKTEFEVRPADGGIQIDLTASNPKDPVKDIHVWMPGFENGKTRFHPLFLERLGPATVLRFMDWQRTNDSPIATWSDRAKPDDPRYSTDKGVPIEVMIELANLKKADPWFCIPHKADDEYVREFAKLVKKLLAPERKVYVEYSNEVWNFQFGQTKYAREQGLTRRLGDPDHARFYSERSVEIFKIWEKEFGKPKLVRVLASQNAVPWLSEQILGWKEAYKHCDALAVAPYFGHAHGDPKNTEKVTRMSTAQLLDELEKEVDGENRDLIRKQADVARKFRVKLIAYEGGQHLTGTGGAENDKTLTKLFHEANRHPRMYDVTRKHLRHWADAGGELYVLFAYVAAPSKWGSWGLLEYQDQPVAEAPKYRAFLDYAGATAKDAKGSKTTAKK